MAKSTLLQVLFYYDIQGQSCIFIKHACRLFK